MLSNQEYIRLSLELNLFFMRIAKEHAIFIEAAFTQRDLPLANEAEVLKNLFTVLLARTILLSEGNLSEAAARSGEFVTDLTCQAEQWTTFYSGIPIDTSLTAAEMQLGYYRQTSATLTLLEQVNLLNQEAIVATTRLAQYKTRVLQDMLVCRLFTHNYPLLLDHILREAHFYLRMLNRLQNRESVESAADLIEQEIFWNRIMAEHAKFIRGLLDPTEDQLIVTAKNFANEFDRLEAEAQQLTTQPQLLPTVTRESREATVRIRDFKRQGTEGLITCRIRSVALPLLGDHVIREANHYLRLLRMVRHDQ